MFQAMADSIVVIDKQSHILFANAAAHTMLGYEPKSLFQKDVKTLMPSAIAEHHDSFVADYGKKPASIIGQQRLVMAKRRNGDLFPIELAVSAHRVGNQQVFVGVIRDMTLRAQAEAKAQERLHLLEMVEQMAGIGYWILDLKLSKVTWSLEVYKIFGLDPSNYEPQLDSAVEMYHPDDRDALVELLEQAQVDHKPFGFELRAIKSDGQIRYVGCKGHVELDHQNQPTALFGIIEDITEYRRAQEHLENHNKELLETAQRLRQQANTDNLTGLSNRRAFYHEAQNILSTASQMTAGVGLLMLDIDHFKRVNDSFGHEMGDKVLIEVAEVLKFNTRGLDMTARFGGEEFVVLLPNSKPHHIRPIAERYCRTVAENKPEGIPQVTVSVGAAYLSTEQLQQLAHLPTHELMDALLRQADQAMYQAKHLGRNQVCCVDFDIP